jgi:hypothetical protein
MSLIHNGMSHSHLLLNITTLYYIFFLWPDKKKNKQNTLLQEGDELVKISNQ